MGVGHCRAGLLHGSRDLRSILRQASAVRARNSAYSSIRNTCTRAEAFEGGASVPLDHGSLDADAAVYRFPSQGWRAVQLGDLSLDRGQCADRVGPLPYLSRVVLAGFLVDLARQDRH